jgi:hypothetical protein
MSQRGNVHLKYSHFAVVDQYVMSKCTVCVPKIAQPFNIFFGWWM